MFWLFAYAFNELKIKCVEASQSYKDNTGYGNSRGKKRKVFVVYSRAYIQITSARGEERKKTVENQMKGKRNGMKSTSNQDQPVYSICVGNPLVNCLPKCLLYLPCLAVRG